MTQWGILPVKVSRWPWTLALILFGALSGVACLRYLSLNSTVFDLGIFVCNLTAIGLGGEWWRMFSGHVQPILWLYAWVVRILPDWLDPLGLMVVQAMALAVPVPFLARRCGALTAVAYVLYFAVWRNGLFDFHPDHVVVPLTFAFFFCEEDDRVVLACLAALSLCLVKETFALQTAACGLYMMLGRNGRGAGAFVFLAGLCWFWLATAKVIPFFTMDSGVGLEAGAFAWLGTGGLAGKFFNLVFHPLTTLSHCLGEPKKLRYLGALFGALGFLPLLAPRVLVVAAAPLALSLLSSRPDYYSYANHYTAGAIAPLVYAFARALPLVARFAQDQGWRLDRLAGLLLLVLAVAHFTLSLSPLSAPFWRGDMRGHFPTDRDIRVIRAMESLLPSDPTVAVVSQNSVNWGKAASRYFANSFPLAVFEDHLAQNMKGVTFAQFWRFAVTGRKPDFPVTPSLAEFVVLDLKRPWFVVDKGCEWRDGACRDQEAAAKFQDALDRLRKDFDVIHEDDGFFIFQRSTP